MNDDNYGALSGGETRLLRIAASLLDGPPVDLNGSLAGLDRQHCQLVLAAIAHASGATRATTLNASGETNAAAKLSPQSVIPTNHRPPNTNVACQAWKRTNRFVGSAASITAPLTHHVL